MSANYWIKLYHETLDDPRMGRLPNNLWRRVIELGLFAGEVETDGQLPPTADIAWRLRLSVEVLEAELQELQAAGFVEKNDGGWLLVDFAEQQAPVPEVERTRRCRERKKEAEYYVKSEQPAPIVTSVGEVGNVIGNETVTSGYTKVTNGVNGVTNGYTDEIRVDQIRLDKDISAKTEKPKKQKTGPPPVIPAFKTFVEVTKCYGITTYWRNKMAEEVGNEPEKLELWQNVLIGWTGVGWNVRNVKGQLECFSRGEIPGKEQRNGHNQNGQHQQSRGNSGRNGQENGGGQWPKKLADYRTGENYWVDEAGQRVTAPVS